jgi:hypothetical protein
MRLSPRLPQAFNQPLTCAATEHARDATVSQSAFSVHSDKRFPSTSRVRLYNRYRAFRLIDRNRIPNFIAFCATAPGVRRSFLAA